MVKRKSKGSLLGRSSSSSKDKTGLYLVMIVAIVAVVALFLMVKGGAQTSSEEVMVVDEAGNLVGEAFRNMDTKFKLSPIDALTNSEEDSHSDMIISSGEFNTKEEKTYDIFKDKVCGETDDEPGPYVPTESEGGDDDAPEPEDEPEEPEPFIPPAPEDPNAPCCTACASSEGPCIYVCDWQMCG